MAIIGCCVSLLRASCHAPALQLSQGGLHDAGASESPVQGTVSASGLATPVSRVSQSGLHDASGR